MKYDMYLLRIKYCYSSMISCSESPRTLNDPNSVITTPHYCGRNKRCGPRRPRSVGAVSVGFFRPLVWSFGEKFTSLRPPAEKKTAHAFSTLFSNNNIVHNIIIILDIMFLCNGIRSR